jgi:cobalt/nickel transport system ATP-binding protein
LDQAFNVSNLYYSYIKPFPVLVNINLAIAKGEKFILLGANGSGKSTLLKLLDGLIFPDSGEIVAFGSPLTEKSLKHNPYSFHQKVGFVFQDSDAQLFCSTVYDEVSFAPLQMGWEPERVRKVMEQTLHEFGLWDLKDRPPYRLSGGEKKKVALASVMIIHPEVLLLDEPTNGLDPRTKKWFLRKLMEFNEKGMTIVIATHDLELGRLLADRALVMNEEHGVEKTGANSEIFENEDLLRRVNLV